MKIQMDKKKWIFSIFALVLVVVLIVAIVMSCISRDIVIENSGSDLSSNFESVDNSGTDSSGSNVSSTDNSANTGSANPTINHVPKTDSSKDDGKHLNDLNNMGGRATLKNNCYSTGYPIADKPVTFKVMIKDYTNQANYKKMKINEFLAEKMNVKIEWELVGLSEVNTKLQLAYASGNLPDLCIGMAPYSIAAQWPYIKQGLVLRLDDYIKEYAPNVQRLLNNNADARYAITAEDGHYYSLPMLNEARRAYVWEGLYINKTWLNKLKLDMPTTTNSFMKVLTAFKNNDPNGNGKADEIPLLLKAWNTTGALPGCLYGPFGLPVYGGYADYSVDDNGKIRANYLTNNYKTALTYYSTLYKNGLIDQDWFGNDDDAIKSKLSAKTNKVGAFVSAEPYSLMSEDRMADYTLVPAFRDKSVDKATWSISGVEYAWGEWFLVTKACKYPEIAVRFADYFYSLEGTMTALQGPQGYNWDVKKDGTIYMKDAYYTGKYENSSLTPGYPLPNYASDEYYALVDKTKSNKTNAHDLKVFKEAKNITNTYVKAAPKNLLPSFVPYSTDKAGNYDYEKLVDYIRSLTVQFLNGSTDINVFWDNYVSVCKQLGSDQMTAEKQKAYDRYVQQQNK